MRLIKIASKYADIALKSSLDNGMWDYEVLTLEGTSSYDQIEYMANFIYMLDIPMTDFPFGSDPQTIIQDLKRDTATLRKVAENGKKSVAHGLNKLDYAEDWYYKAKRKRGPSPQGVMAVDTDPRDVELKPKDITTNTYHSHLYITIVFTGEIGWTLQL